GGNYGIETNSDNLGIASGSFELGSGKGDSFTLADADGSTLKWITSPTGCSPGASETRAISGGVYDISGVNTGFSGFVSQFTISGNIDYRMKLQRVSGDTNDYAEFTMLNEQMCSYSGGTVDGFYVQDSSADSGGSAIGTINNGAFSLVTAGLTFTNPSWARITRSSDTWAFYKSSDGSNWTFVASAAQVAGSTLYPSIRFRD